MPVTPVLYVIDSLDVAGTERQLSLTLEHLNRDAFAPSVLGLFRRGPYADAIEALGIPVAIAGATPGAFRENARIVEEAAREHSAQIIHPMLFESHIAGQFAARRLGVLGVTHLVNEYGSPFRAQVEALPRWKVAAAAQLERYAARRSRARFVAVANVVADSAAPFFHVSRSSIPVVRRGFLFDELERAAAGGLAAPAWSASAEPTLLAVGRLMSQKGQRYLVEAMPEVLAAFPNAQLLIAGEGPLRAELIASAAVGGISEHIVFPGVRHDVPALIDQADVFVFPSLWEGAAGALVEALGLGAVVVASDIPAHRELTQGSELVQPADAAALAGGIIEALRDLPARTNMAVAAAGAIRAAHDIVQNTRLLEATYTRFLAEFRATS